MSQLAFNLQLSPSYNPEDFVVSESNQAAVDCLDSWGADRPGILLLIGDKSAGKTHLAMLWAVKNNAVFLDNELLGKVDSEQIWQKGNAAILEDMDTIKDQTALFHLLRLVENNKYRLLITSSKAVPDLGLTLPDLSSRLAAATNVRIELPDEFLLTVFLSKFFSDRQLRVSEEVINYIIRRLERSFEQVYKFAEKIEQASLEQKREITIPFIKTIY